MTEETISCAKCSRIVCVAHALPIVRRDTAGPLSTPFGYVCSECHCGRQWATGIPDWQAAQKQPTATPAAGGGQA
jgi:hypothetical protein